MKELSRKQFNRLTSVQKVKRFHKAFNERNQNILDNYNYYRQKEESDEDGKENFKILSDSFSWHFKETLELLSELEEEYMYVMCQHYGAIDPDFKKEIDELCPSEDESYWTGKTLSKTKLNDVCNTIDLIKNMKQEIENSPLNALIMYEDKESV